ncbi:MAG: NAD(P)/FAD-dependent oxidoreductase [Anaerolineales bacterium]
MSYDVIIAGASFAGLAVAAQLPGKRVLLLDRKPIGTGQTSACGTFVSILQSLDLGDAIQQIHDRILLHTPGRTFVFPVTEPLCTFDYSLLCHLLRQRGDAEFVLSPVLELNGKGVRTPQDTYQGEFVVDATGWRAALGNSKRPELVARDRLNFGIEAAITYEGDGLHFWYDPVRLLPKGITWVFPANGKARIGIASYLGATRLRGGLDRFLGDLALPSDGLGLHGGYFPHALRHPFAGDVFLVGDAAGQCLGFSGEGIRPALFFGTHLGRLIGKVLEGQMSMELARQEYDTLVSNRKRGYDLLCFAQQILPRLPLPLLKMFIGLVASPKILNRMLPRYERAFSLNVPQARAGSVEIGHPQSIGR